MTEKELFDLTEEFHVLNVVLEICRGYTQADMPDMKMFDTALLFLYDRYNELCERIEECEKGKG